MIRLPLLVLGVVATLFAQFGMDSLADTNQLAHWLQHGLLFAGGVAVGGSLWAAYRASAGRLA